MKTIIVSSLLMSTFIAALSWAKPLAAPSYIDMNSETAMPKCRTFLKDATSTSDLGFVLEEHMTANQVQMLRKANGQTPGSLNAAADLGVLFVRRTGLPLGIATFIRNRFTVSELVDIVTQHIDGQESGLGVDRDLKEFLTKSGVVNQDKLASRIRIRFKLVDAEVKIMAYRYDVDILEYAQKVNKLRGVIANNDGDDTSRANALAELTIMVYSPRADYLPSDLLKDLRVAFKNETTFGQIVSSFRRMRRSLDEPVVRFVWGGEFVQAARARVIRIIDYQLSTRPK